MSETLQGMEGRLEAWDGALESKGLRVNVMKTKIMISNENAGKVSFSKKASLLVLLQKGLDSIAGIEWIRDEVMC